MKIGQSLEFAKILLPSCLPTYIIKICDCSLATTPDFLLEFGIYSPIMLGMYYK